MTAPLPFYRSRAIERVQDKLERGAFPRLQMVLLVALTGAAGFVASYLFLHAGLHTMWIRYLVSFGVAYAAFLALLWLWLRSTAADYADLPDLTEIADMIPSGSGIPDTILTSKGGSFDGGGASASFDTLAAHTSASADSGVIGDALGSAVDADEFAIPLALVVLVGALLLSSLFMIYSAPVLFAEMIVDGMLSAGLYRRLRGLREGNWLKTALRRTAWPFALTAAIAAGAGWAMEASVPHAHSIGDVIAHSAAAPTAH